MKKLLGTITLAVAILSTSVFPVLASGVNTSKSIPTITNISYSKKTVKVTKVILNKKKITLNVGSSEKLIPTITPSTATNQNVIWNSNQPNVATVDADGNVTGKKIGTAVITVVSVEGKKKTTCLVKVVKANDLTINSISDLKQTVNQGENYLLPQTVEATMSDGTKKQVSITWNPLTVDTSVIGEQTFKGSVVGYSGQVTMTVTVVKVNELTISSISDLKQTVNQGENYLLPQTVEATMSDGTKTQVSVTWNPLTVDTSVIGDQTFKGSVIGYSGQVTLTVTVVSAVIVGN